MNLATILVAIPVAALIIWAAIKTFRNRGRCSGCDGCSSCNSCSSCKDYSGGCGKDG